MSPLPGQEEPLQRLTKVVNTFLSRPDSGPFREPVDWRGLELYDYPEVITHMMDLGTVKRKLDRNQYQTASQCASEIRLVWSNCMTYNAEGSDFWILAKAFSKRFEDKYRKIKSEFDVGEDLQEEKEDKDEGEDDEDDDEDGDEDEEAEYEGEEEEEEDAGGVSSEAPTLDARARLASNLLLLNGAELGMVISMIERLCPAALEPGNLPDKIEIVIDHMDAVSFAKVSQFAADKTQHRKRKAAPVIDDISNKRKRRR